MGGRGTKTLAMLQYDNLLTLTSTYAPFEEQEWIRRWANVSLCSDLG